MFLIAYMLVRLHPLRYQALSAEQIHTRLVAEGIAQPGALLLQGPDGIHLANNPREITGQDAPCKLLPGEHK